MLWSTHLEAPVLHLHVTFFLDIYSNLIKKKKKKKNSSQTICFLNVAPDCARARKLPVMQQLSRKTFDSRNHSPF